MAQLALNALKRTLEHKEMARLPELLNSAQAAKYIGVHRNTLRYWNRVGDGPPRVRKGKTFYYVKELVREWLSSGAVSPRAPAPRGLSQRLAGLPSAALRIVDRD